MRMLQTDGNISVSLRRLSLFNQQRVSRGYIYITSSFCLSFCFHSYFSVCFVFLFISSSLPATSSFSSFFLSSCLSVCSFLFTFCHTNHSFTPPSASLRFLHHSLRFARRLRSAAPTSVSVRFTMALTRRRPLDCGGPGALQIRSVSLTMPSPQIVGTCHRQRKADPVRLSGSDSHYVSTEWLKVVKHYNGV